ncbi:SRPBCC family protein [Luteipulveratus halotolerans]|uniref:Polyketide cyclase n=1 Tax=Luteipulveratus halotolerans TaxID=1631356 RepID=A0A0L6CMS3_9MICO|nr:SRPBCC family protein [Luteipulveratus halotolerans]KNX39012.1 hypothetical protein VV01_20770 [Luteipulveratus halotolerans]
MAHFRFASSYDLDAPAGRVFAALSHPDEWDRWWPQIRTIIRYDDASGLVVIRSVLPVTLRVVISREVVDPAGGELRAGLSGDLTGWARFVVRPLPVGAHVAYAQECTVSKRGLSRVSGALRPVLVANHAVMMRAGMRGLASYAHSPGEM